MLDDQDKAWLEQNFRGLNQRFGAIEGRLDVLGARFSALEQKVSVLDEKIERVETSLLTEFKNGRLLPRPVHVLMPQQFGPSTLN